MKIARAEIIPYALPLARELPQLAGSARERRGLLLRLESGEGLVEYGEMAPLPGFSRETLSDARTQAHDLAARLPGLGDWPDDPSGLLAAAAREPLHASVRFGLETALLNLASLRSGLSWHRALGRPVIASVRVNALASGSEADILRAAHRAAADGFACLKIKVWHLSVPAAAQLVRQLHAECPGLALRLDANRSWSLDSALAFAEEVRDCAVDYVEEPLQHPEDVPAFRARSGLRVALDESLAEGERTRRTQRADQPPDIDVWVIKPTLRGGIAATLALADEALRQGAKPVISSGFESGVGLRALFQLAAVTHDADRPAGLGTGLWFAHDLLTAPIPIVRGVCHVDEHVRYPTPVAREYLHQD